MSKISKEQRAFRQRVRESLKKTCVEIQELETDLNTCVNLSATGRQAIQKKLELLNARRRLYETTLPKEMR